MKACANGAAFAATALAGLPGVPCSGEEEPSSALEARLSVSEVTEDWDVGGVIPGPAGGCSAPWPGVTLSGGTSVFVVFHDCDHAREESFSDPVVRPSACTVDRRWVIREAAMVNRGSSRGRPRSKVARRAVVIRRGITETSWCDDNFGRGLGRTGRHPCVHHRLMRDRTARC